MPRLTKENIKRIVRLSEIADELKAKQITPKQAQAEVQSILDEFNRQDGIPSNATPTTREERVESNMEEPYERPLRDRLARHNMELGPLDGFDY